MAIRSLKTGQFSRSMLVGNNYFVPNSFESIATLTATGSTMSVTFSNIPSSYKHLQIRVLERNVASGNSDSNFLRFNGDTGSNYSRHYLYGDGSAAGSSGIASRTSILTTLFCSDSTSIPTVSIIDIHDYASTTKNKTIRSFGGYDKNGSGYITLSSGVWLSTSAVTSITLLKEAVNYTADSVFALYGIKGD